jgi:hypothetical protein
MVDQSSAPDVDAVRRTAAASGIDLPDDRAERLAAAVARHRAQMAKVDRLDLGDREPGVADPAAGR